mgnify:CR=1 FL=1
MPALQEQHARMVAELKKDPIEIPLYMTARDYDLIHMVMGICGEAGELLDAIKKSVIYNRPLDRENVIEELGDIEFYMQGLRESLLIDRQETLQHNITKLRTRYGSEYSDQAAQERADKA